MGQGQSARFGSSITVFHYARLPTISKGMMIKMFKQLSPCKDCINRALGCHSTCKSYKEWEELEQRTAREVARNACKNMRTKRESNGI